MIDRELAAACRRGCLWLLKVSPAYLEFREVLCGRLSEYYGFPLSDRESRELEVVHYFRR